MGIYLISQTGTFEEVLSKLKFNLCVGFLDFESTDPITQCQDIVHNEHNRCIYYDVHIDSCFQCNRLKKDV